MLEILKKRRENLAKAMGSGAALLYTAPTATRSNDTHYPYRGNSHFLYLTDYVESQAAMLLIADGHQAPKFYLFVKANDPLTALWDGPKASFDDVKKATGADDVFDIKNIEEKVIALTPDCKQFFVDLDSDTLGQKLVKDVTGKKKINGRKSTLPVEGIQNLATLVGELRLIKDDLCFSRLEKAVSFSSEAHREAMRAIRPGMNETEIAALVEFIFARHGGTTSYGTIAGGGQNACILHYVDNNHVLKDGDLFLLDAGMEYKGYAGDITRTFPVNGKFTEAQKNIYNIVLKANEEAIATCTAGTEYFDFHHVARKVMAEELINLGLLKGSVEENLEGERYKKYYPHSTGHFLGIDVHDTGKYFGDDKKYIPLQEGIVMTVEPGLYLPLNDETLPEEYRGIGIRIEDDIVITQGAPRVLSHEAPKTVEEIEATCAEDSFYPYIVKQQSAPCC